MKIEAENKVVTTYRYVAEDGTVYDNEEACIEHENYINYKSKLSEVPCLDEYYNYPPCDGGENIESHSYHWYKPDTMDHIEILKNVYSGAYIGDRDIGKWICIEEGYDGDCWCFASVDSCMDYVTKFFRKFGYDVEFKERKETNHDEI